MQEFHVPAQPAQPAMTITVYDQGEPSKKQSSTSSAMIYTHADPDGYAAAAIVRSKYPYAWIEPVVAGATIRQSVLRPGEPVFVLDFTFSLEDMKYLCEHHPVVYINHHDKPTQELLNAGLKFQGSWKDDEAACVQTWRYIYPDLEVPKAIQWIGDLDSWSLKHKESIPFNYGMRMLHTKPIPTNDKLWKALIAGEPELLYSILDRGRMIENYTDSLYQAYAQDLAYVTEFAGHKFMAMNVRGIISLAFKFCDLTDCKGVIAYRWINDTQSYRVSVFGIGNREQQVDGLDMAELVIPYNGNGHRGAAGFSCTELPFKQAVMPGKSPTYENPYLDVHKKLEELPGLDAYVVACSRSTAYGAAFSTTFEGLPAVGVNTPETDNRTLNMLNTINSKLGIYFVWTNCGKYRIILKALCSDLDLTPIVAKYGGQMVGNSGWFYVDQLPFTLQKYVK